FAHLCLPHPCLSTCASLTPTLSRSPLHSPALLTLSRSPRRRSPLLGAGAVHFQLPPVDPIGIARDQNRPVLVVIVGFIDHEQRRTLVDLQFLGCGAVSHRGRQPHLRIR